MDKTPPQGRKIQFISFAGSQSQLASKGPKPPQINNLFANVVPNPVPKAAKLDLHCQGSQSSFRKAEDLSSDEEDVDSEDEDGMSQSAGSRPNKNSIASFQNQMTVQQERRKQHVNDSLSSLSIISKGTNRLDAKNRKELTQSSQKPEEMLLHEHFVNGVTMEPGTKSYMPQHTSFSLQRGRISMGEKNKSFGNQTNVAPKQSKLSFNTSTGMPTSQKQRPPDAVSGRPTLQQNQLGSPDNIPKPAMLNQNDLSSDSNSHFFSEGSSIMSRSLNSGVNKSQKSGISQHGSQRAKDGREKKRLSKERILQEQLQEVQSQNIILQLERYDYQDIRSDKTFLQCAQDVSGGVEGDELVIMSDKVLLMNQWSGWDNMQFVATTSCIYLYSVEQSKIKRAVPYDQVQGVSIGLKEQIKKHTKAIVSEQDYMSVEVTSQGSQAAGQKQVQRILTQPSGSTEHQALEPFLLQDFIVHVRGQQEDIRAKSTNQRQQQLIEVIRYFCDQNLSLNRRKEQQKEPTDPNLGRPLPVFGCFELRQYHKSQKDAQRGIEKMPGDYLIINKRLQPYPDFSIIAEFLRGTPPEQWRTSSLNFRQPFQNVLAPTGQGNNAVLHHGGQQRDANQMYTFHSSLFDSQQFNDNSFFGDLEHNEQLLKKEFLGHSDSESSANSSNDQEKQLKRVNGDIQEERNKAGELRGKKDLAGQITEDCLKEKKKAVEVPQHIAQVQWFQKMRQEKERDRTGSATQSIDDRARTQSASLGSAQGNEGTETAAVKSRGNAFNSVKMQPIMESIGEEDQFETRQQSQTVHSHKDSSTLVNSEDVGNEIREINEQIERRGSMSSTLYSSSTAMTAKLHSFRLIKMLGQGSFGKVYLVQNHINILKNQKQRHKQKMKPGQQLEKEYPEFFAMKVVSKENSRGQKLSNIICEKKVLLQFSHPFIVDVHYVFENEKRVYFVMNYMRCGDLYKQLQSRSYFKESVAKFYAAQIILAIGCLHDQKVIYRDLKLENILLQDDGYVNLADFGMVKFLDDWDDQMRTFVGTRPYLAPEIVENKKYDRTVDWWAMGILLFEMMFGRLPFYDKNPRVLFDKIVKEDVVFPEQVYVRSQNTQKDISVSDDAQDLIKQLLQKNPKKRLGQKNGFKDILTHPWFSDTDCEKLLQKKVRPKYVPAYKEGCPSESVSSATHKQIFGTSKDLTPSKTKYN